MATSILYGLLPLSTTASLVAPVLLFRAKTRATSATPILRTTLSLNLCIHHSFSATSSTRPNSRIPLKSTIPSQTYIYIPEFAQSETKKFRTELFKKLSEDKETFGDDLDRVVDVCSQKRNSSLQAA